MLRLRVAGLPVFLTAATLLVHLTSAQNQPADELANRTAAQIAHHTELPYIRDPPEHSSDVGHYPGPNDEDNDVNVMNKLDPLDIVGRVLPPASQHPGLQLTSAASPSPVAPYEHPHPPSTYNQLHRWYKQTHRPAYEVRTFNCTFENHMCGMRNQKNIGQNFLLVSNRLAGRPGRYMAVDAERVGQGVSRLITPYLPGHPNALVCLRLTYFLGGPGAESIQMVAQDVGNRHLFSLEDHGNVWRTFGINMTIQQDVRFFIEAYTKNQPGVIAIDDFTYSFDPCPSKFHLR